MSTTEMIDHQVNIHDSTIFQLSADQFVWVRRIREQRDARGKRKSCLDTLTRKTENRYSLVEEIACGGMKRVLRVHDYDTDRDVVMAVMLDRGASLSDKERFVREARMTAALEHPNIVPIHDIGLDRDRYPYFTMKLLKGKTLREIIDRVNEGEEYYVKKFTLRYYLQLFQKVCYGVEFAHSKGVAHLDLKPENIHVGRFGEVVILDWGLAKIFNQSNPVAGTELSMGLRLNRPEETLDGTAKGSLGFMAPEQASGDNGAKNHRTDIYGLGAILYAMLTGKRCVDGDNVYDFLRKTTQGEIVPPRRRASDKDIPNRVESIIMRALATDPDERHESVRTMRKEMARFLADHAPNRPRGRFSRRFLGLFRGG